MSNLTNNNSSSSLSAMATIFNNNAGYANPSSINPFFYQAFLRYSNTQNNSELQQQNTLNFFTM